MLDARLFPEPRPHADPRLIASNHLMQLSTIELEQAISQELEENPALELVERSTCPHCGAALRSGFCQGCTGVEPFTSEAPLSSETGLSEASRYEDNEQDPLSFVAVPMTLPEQLLAQLRLAMDPRDYAIALHLVGNLDEHGYLRITVEELSHMLQVEPERVEAALDELQRLDPAGIGARDVTECLLLQLERLSEQGITPPPSTRRILQDYWEALGHHQFDHIRTALQIRREEVEEVFLFVRANLHPYPAHHYYAQGDTASASPPVVPSVLIHRSTTAVCGYEVEIVESHRFGLRLNPLYQRLKQQPNQTLSPGEAEHVAQFLERARLFLQQIQRRQTLLQRVSTYLVEYQCAFLDQGALALRPLTQKTVADALGIHISTISRAIASKFAQIPSQELLPLSRFFSAELRVQELIRQLITNETTPLSDALIARQLQDEYGITLSRQMVANYRVELHLPAARQRALLRRS